MLFWNLEPFCLFLTSAEKASLKIVCSRLSDSGEVKVKGTRKVSSRFIFVFALSQFSRPDYLGAWNRLVLKWSSDKQGNVLFP